MAARPSSTFPRRATGAMLVALLLAGCPGGGSPTGPGKPATPRPSARAAEPSAAPAVRGTPLAVPAAALAKATAGLATRAISGGVATTLAGQARVIANHGAGIIANNGGGIISNNTGGIISDNGAGIIGDNGAGVIANNGGGYRLKQQAQAVSELRLAEAVVTVHDAAGKLLTDAAGKPLAAFTDRQGRYVLEAPLPAENVVLKVRLWNGGELAAMRPKDGGADQPLDTATSLGAAYVLSTFVKGSQATFDKLPASEADALRAAIEAAKGAPTEAPSYAPADLLARADGLRQSVPAVGKKIEDIRALLIGQANLGDGRPATEVALPVPRAMIVDNRGHLLMCDQTLGRIRDLAPDGRLSTLADGYRGTLIKQNFLNIEGMAQAGDGTLYVTAGRRGTAIAPDGSFRFFAGNGGEDRGEAGIAATAMAIVPRTPAVAPDGRVWILDDSTPPGSTGSILRLLEIAPDGIAKDVPLDPKLLGINQNAVGRDAAGNLYLSTPTATTQRILKLPPGGSWVLHATWPEELVLGGSGFAVAADGTVYSTDFVGRKVTRVAPDGTVGVAAGTGAIPLPGVLAIASDGTLYVADEDHNLIYMVPPGGTARVVAGASGVVSRAGELTEIALNAPFATALDAEGRFIFTENQGFALKRFTGSTVETVAGIGRGRLGDGGPAAQARFDSPIGVAQKDGTTWVIDSGYGSLRRIDPAGMIHWAAGPRQDARDPRAGTGNVEVGARVPADSVQLREARFVAVGPDGRPYLTTGSGGQVLRLDADGMLAHVAGKPVRMDERAGAIGAGMLGIADGSSAFEASLVAPNGLAFDAAGDLYVADALGCRIVRISDPGGPAPKIHTFAGEPIPALMGRATAGAKLDIAAELRKPKLELPLPFPSGIAFDGDGALLVSVIGTRAMLGLPELASNDLLKDFPAAEACVVRIPREGPATMVAGPGSRYFGDVAAEDALLLPGGLAIDAQGRLAICDPGANTLRILPPGTAVPPR